MTFWLDISNARFGSFGWPTHWFRLCRTAEFSPFLWINLKNWYSFLCIRNATRCSNKELRSNGTLSQTLRYSCHLFLIDSSYDFHLLSVLLQDTNLWIGWAGRTSYQYIWFQLVALKPQGIRDLWVTGDETRQGKLFLVGLCVKELKVAIEKASKIGGWFMWWDERFNYRYPFILRLRSFLFRSFECK